MQKSGRKLSDFTCNSPSSKVGGVGFFFSKVENDSIDFSGRSAKSKYSNSSKLTQSQLFSVLTKAHEK